MAKAFLERSESQFIEADSAGTMPADDVDPVVVEVMKEVGIDISENRPRLITQDIVDGCDKVITMGCSIDEACPAKFIASEDWGLADPKGQQIGEIRKIRDEIRLKVTDLLERL